MSKKWTFVRVVYRKGLFFMKLLYRLHRWLSAVCALFFLMLCITGLPLLFKDEITQWNRVEPLPHAGTSSYRELWQGTSAGLEKVLAANPDKKVQAISAMPEHGLLLYRIADKESHGRTGRMSMGGMQIAYAPAADEAVPWRSGEVKSPAVASLMHTLHILHLRLAMGQGGMIFLGIMCFLSFLSIVVGLLLYPTFMRHRLFGGTRGGMSAGSFFDWHNFFGILTAVWAGLLTLSGVAIVIFSVGYGAYLADVDAHAPQGDAAHVSYEDMFAYAGEAFPEQDVLSMESATGKLSATLYLTDRAHPAMFMGQKVLFARAANGELEHFTEPLPRYLAVCASLLDLHIHNHPTLLLKIIWLVLDVMTIVVIVTGFLGWWQRSHRQKERRPVFADGRGKSLLTSVWKLPALLAVLSLIGMTAPLTDTFLGNAVGSLAWLFALALGGAAWLFARRP